MDLYRYIPIWRHVDDGVALYRCLEVLGEGYTVQSKDIFTLGTVKEMRDNLANADVQFVELFMDEAPEMRLAPQATLEEAIAKFDEQQS